MLPHVDFCQECEYIATIRLQSWLTKSTHCLQTGEQVCETGFRESGHHIVAKSTAVCRRLFLKKSFCLFTCDGILLFANMVYTISEAFDLVGQELAIHFHNQDFVSSKDGRSPDPVCCLDFLRFRVFRVGILQVGIDILCVILYAMKDFKLNKPPFYNHSYIESMGVRTVRFCE